MKQEKLKHTLDSLKAKKEAEESEKHRGFFRNMIANRDTAKGQDISATGVMGSVTIGVGLIAFISLIVFYILETSEAGNIIQLIDKATIIVTLGGTILGVRKVSGVFNRRISSKTGKDGSVTPLTQDELIEILETALDHENGECGENCPDHEPDNQSDGDPETPIEGETYIPNL